MTFGISRLLCDLELLGFRNVTTIQDAQSNSFAVINQYEILLGRFAGKKVELAIPAPADYGRVVGSAIHLRSKPHLLDKNDSVPNVKNITDSSLGPDWRYWSHRFEFDAINPTQHLMFQINGIMRRA